jgi:hypothetical protein
MGLVLSIVARSLHCQDLPIGFEATLVFDGYCFWLATGSAVTALGIAVVRAFRKKSGHVELPV